MKRFPEADSDNLLYRSYSFQNFCISGSRITAFALWPNPVSGRRIVDANGFGGFLPSTFRYQTTQYSSEVQLLFKHNTCVLCSGKSSPFAFSDVEKAGRVIGIEWRN